MANFPRDRFDDIPKDIDRVGAHRAIDRPGRRWMGLAWAALATVVLVALGLFALALLDGRFDGEEPTVSDSAPPPADPVLDPATVDPAVLEALTISVLNGTPTEGLSNVAADQIVALGWPNPSRASASSTEEESTIVYYRDEEDEGIARGIAVLLGIDELEGVQLSDAFPATDLTVVLGEDYVPPSTPPVVDDEDADGAESEAG